MRNRKPAQRRNDRRTQPRRRLGAESLEDRRLLATFTVTITGDSGAGSLRDAIDQANLSPGFDQLRFNIAGTGVQTIAPASALPEITGPLSIDGTTQPGFDPNDPRPLIELDGRAVAVNPGLDFSDASSGSTVRGLIVNRFGGDGIRLRGNNNRVEGNSIGTTADGAAAAGNGGEGVNMDTSSNNTIGGTSAATRNVISGNASHGVGFGALFAVESAGSQILGNYIGTDRTGAVAVPNGGNGVDFFGGGNNTIGGLVAGSGNLISGNDGHGIVFFGGGTANNLVVGNLIGTDLTGTLALGNGRAGVNDFSTTNTVGGTTPEARNVISANRAGGIDVFGGTSSLFQGNLIGTDVTGTLPLGNVGFGVKLFADDNTVGGTAAGAGNVIAFTTPDAFGQAAGITTVLSSSNNRFLSNSIFGNAGLGIDLENDRQVEPNDPNDADTGGNGLQNYPVITGAETGGGVTIVRGTFNSVPNRSYQLQFFGNDAPDSTGFGEGKTLLGTLSLTTGSTGNATFDLPFSVELAAGQFVTATATDPGGNTSEFGQAVSVNVLPATDLLVEVTSAPSPGTVGANLTYTVTVRNVGALTTTGAVLTATLPANATFVSATGGVAPDMNGVLTFNIGNLAAAASASFDVTVRPTTAGTVTLAVAVDHDLIDPVPVNNSAAADATVVAPTGTSVVQFSAPEFNVIESAGTIEVSISRSNGTAPLTVNYAVTPGTATAGSDFTPTAGSVTFAEGQTVATFAVAILPDFIIEGPESFNVAISAPTGGAVLAIPGNTAIVTILDDDPSPPATGRIQFATGTYSFAEGVGQAEVVINRVGGAAGVATVRFRALADTATAGADFEAQDYVITFADGDAVPKFVMIPIVDDATPENDEDVRLTLTNATGATLGGPATATLTIRSDDLAPPPPGMQTATFLAAAFNAIENGGVATITIARNSPVGAAIVDFATGPGGTAVAGQRFTPVSGSVAFSDGQSSVTFDVPLIDTGAFEGNQTVVLTIAASLGGIAIGQPSTAVLTIVDDEPAPPPVPSLFEFATASFVAAENGGAAVITINRTGGLAAATITVTTAGLTAVAGIDFTTVNQVVGFADGQATATVAVPLIDNLRDEADRFVQLTLSNPTGVAGLGPVSTAILTIADDELDLTPAFVTGTALAGDARGITAVTIGFSEGLNPFTASNPFNYAILGLGRDGRLGTRDDRVVPVAAAFYNPLSFAVTVVPGRILNAGQQFLVVANASTLGGLADAGGNLLDGDGDGRAGGNLERFVARGTRLTYADRDGDSVTFTLGRGGQLDLIRGLDGAARSLRIVNPIAGRSILDGSVRRSRVGNGLATVGLVIGLDNFGTVRSRLTTPPFVFGEIVGSAVDELLALSGGSLASRRNRREG